ncbi:MAG: hypothetical protein GY786_20665 [Proteobacteria bacterium]|nr:hypothetical protein [Pseudomonadota bacterium]
MVIWPALVSMALPYDKIRVVIHDRVITQNEIEIRTFESIKGLRDKPDSKEKQQQIHDQVLNQLIDETLLDLYGDELSIRISSEQLDNAIEELKKQRKLSQYDFESLLEQQQITLQQFKINYRQSLRQKQLLGREVHSKIQVDLKQLESEYQKNQDGIREIKASHILLRLNKNASAAEEKKVLDKIQLIKSELAKGKSFSTMADLYSEDPSAKTNHGNLGFFQKSNMVKEFSEVAFSLPTGKISDPIRTAFGYHLISVTEERVLDAKPFDEVKNRLYQTAYQKQYLVKYNELITSLRKKYKIVNHP